MRGFLLFCSSISSTAENGILKNATLIQNKTTTGGSQPKIKHTVISKLTAPWKHFTLKLIGINYPGLAEIPAPVGSQDVMSQN